MPSKTFLPGCKITFHPIYADGDASTHLWVTRDSIESLEKEQIQFIMALKLLMENGVSISWSTEFRELENKIRLSIGLNKKGE